VIYFNSPSWMGDYSHPLQCVDGLQRLTALIRFLKDEIKAFGYYYSEYEGHPSHHSMTLKVNINSLQTREEVLEWYLQFNSGGTIHSEDELNKVRKLLEEEKNKSNER